MRNSIYIIILILTNTVFSQNTKETNQSIINSIKNSKEILEFAKTYEIDKIKLKIKTDLYPFCENYSFFKKGLLNDNILSSCKNFDILQYKFKKDQNLNNFNDRGCKSFTLFFTETIDNYLIVEVRYINVKSQGLLYLIKLSKDDSVKIIDSLKLFYN